jgi:adenosylcobinamide-GDP ribazoletransferase
MKLIPIVGILIGSLMYLINAGLAGFASDIRGLILTIFYIFITGGLHIDGYMDSMDGLLSNRDKDRIIEIMKDSRVGSFGVISMVVLFALYSVFMGYSQGEILFLMPVVGRCSGIVSAGITPYAKKNLDLGGRFVEETKPKHAVAAVLFSGMISLVFFIVKWIEGKIQGTTGDTTGMVIESSQALFLILSYFYFS